MSYKLEAVRSFLGFGESDRQGAYYFSRGMTHKEGGIQAGWEVNEDENSNDLATLGLVSFFEERLESGSSVIYAVDIGGEVFQRSGGSWSSVRTPSDSHGNGLIVDHSGSQRLLYLSDEYVGMYDGSVWADDWQDFGKSQNINRPADIYEDWVVMGNGTSVAILNVTDDSFNAAGLTLPAQFEVQDLKSGKTGVLVGANFNGRGVLVLWDAQADRSLTEWIWTEGQIYGIAKYQGAWLVSTGREIILTDGYTIARRYPFPDMNVTTENFGPWYIAGISVKGDKLMVSSRSHSFNRRKKGIFVLDLVTELWEFMPYSDGDLYADRTGAIFTSSDNITYVSWRSTDSYIGTVDDSQGSTCFISAPFGSGSGSRKRVEGVILDLGFKREDINQSADPDWKIEVKLYDFRKPLWGYAQQKENATTRENIIVDGSADGCNNAEIGWEVTVLEGTSAGRSRHITAVSGAGTTTETWTLDAELSDKLASGDNINVMPFIKVGEKYVNQLEVLNDRLYIPVQKSIVGKKFLVKVDIECGSDYSRPRIDNMWLFYQELGEQ